MIERSNSDPSLVASFPAYRRGIQGLQDYYIFIRSILKTARADKPRPKIDIYHDYHFLILHFPSMDIQGAFIEPKRLRYSGKDFLITWKIALAGERVVQTGAK